MLNLLRITVPGAILLFFLTPVFAQEPNYDEAKVPSYTVPDPLMLSNGKKVTQPGTWTAQRRKEILQLFREEMYGKSPGKPAAMRFEVRSIDKNALEGKATRKEVRVHFSAKQDGPRMDILIYLPNNVKKPPLFLGLNFYGNHTVHSDPAITLSDQWMMNNKQIGTENNRATEATRGARTNRWPVERILERGYGIATIYYGDIDPDFDDGFQNGVHPLFYKERQKQPSPNEWGSIAAWAWGLSRAMDYFTLNTIIMKSTLKKLPLILAFAVAILASGCVEETTIEPTRTEEDKNPPPPPPPTGYNAVFSDITAVPAA